MKSRKGCEGLSSDDSLILEYECLSQVNSLEEGVCCGHSTPKSELPQI